MASDSEPLERDQRTRQRRAARIKRFEERQRKTRERINFAEIAEWCSEEDSIEPNEDKRAWAFKKLADDLLAGEFEENGHSRVHFLYRDTAKRVTPKWFKDVVDYNWDGHHGWFILVHCWMHRRSMFKRWCTKHRLPESPPRFEPRAKQSLARLKKPKRGRPAEYDWNGVKSQLAAYILEHGPVQTSDELLQKCTDFATNTNPQIE